MKLRIKDNSIRLRLSKSEVVSFGIEKSHESKIHFADKVLIYKIEMSHSIHKIKATFNGNEIKVNIPNEVAIDWINTEIVGLQHEQILSNGNKLLILIEKDFVCIDNTLEDQSDNYPNPNAVC